MLFCSDFCGILVKNCGKYTNKWRLTVKFVKKYRKFVTINENMLVKYCRIGDLNMVKFLISTNNIVKYYNYIENIRGFSSDKEFYDEIYATPYYEAIKYGNLNIVQLFVNEMGTFSDGRSFELAINYGHLDIVQFLVSKDASINNPYVDTINTAVQNNNFEIVKYFVENGADINKRCSDPIVIAVQKNNFKIVKYLVENGSNITFKSNFSLCLASENGYLDIVQYLVEKGLDIDEPLLLASEHGHLEVVKYLLKTNVCPSIHSAIQQASDNNYLDIVQLLLENGADIKKNNYQAIRNLLRHGHIELVKKLIKKL